MTSAFDELLACIEERSAALRSAVSAAPDPSARVPGCPDWTLRDLVGHLGAVQRFWAIIVRTGERPDPVPDMTPAGELTEWFDASTAELIGALRDAGPDKPCWTWWPESEAPQTAGAVARHQVQEAAVHAYDAQETIGRPDAVPEAVAVDAVAEFLQVTFGAEGKWPHPAARMVFVPEPGPELTLDLSDAGARLVPGGGAAAATVRAPASDLLLALFGRVPLDRVTVDGDAEVLRQLIAWGDTE